jgi:hypothetical protein
MESSSLLEHRPIYYGIGAGRTFSRTPDFLRDVRYTGSERRAAPE